MDKVFTISDTEDIIHRLKKNEEPAIDELYAYFYPRLYRFSKSILKIEHEIDDVIQEVFVKIWLNRHKIGKAETFNSFIFTITKNEVLNLIRSKVKDRTFRDELFKRSVAKEYHDQDNIEFNEIKACIDKSIAGLPERRSLVFNLSRNEGLSNKEIAKQLNISEKTVEDHITHALKSVRGSMKEMEFIFLLYFYLFL